MESDIEEQQGIVEEPTDFDQEDVKVLLAYDEMHQRMLPGADVMGTYIEGGGALVRAQERVEARMLGTFIDRRLLSYFREVKNIYRRFGVDEEVVMFDKFHSLKHYEYKNPVVYILAYIAYREKKLTKQRLVELMSLAKQTNAQNIVEADIVRYYRLLTSLDGG